MCIALVVFSSWRLGRAFFGTLLFAFFDAYQLRLQQAVADAAPYHLFLMVPYLMSIVTLLFIAGAPARRRR